ncbi:MAG: cupin domain-containing protein [Syntrophomonas sp.]|nr:cupin domain-containing protein [Syntrophomonas sp.]
MKRYNDDRCICPKCPKFDKCSRHFYDHGPCPFVTNITKETLRNNNYRTALWTGKYLQLTLMSIEDEIGVEMHPNLDQFIRLEQGEGIIMMGDSRNSLNFQRKVRDDYVIFIPAGTWHNLINTGHDPIKLYSIYAPPQHPWGTVQETRADAEEDH